VSGEHTQRTQRWILQRWPAIRAQGFTRFLLLRGLATWGGLMFVAMAVMVTLKLGTDHPRLPMLVGIAAALCAFGGVFWAAATWWINERLYRTMRGARDA
jgi:hypothetical protein